MSDKLKVAIYCRVACEDNDAIERQEIQVRDYASNQGHNDIAVYSDNGYNGLTFDRPAFMRMESDIEAGEIGMVISRDLSRISRNTLDTFDWLGRIKRSGIMFKSVNEGMIDSCFLNFGNALRKAYREHLTQQR